MRINFHETSGAQGTADHVRLFATESLLSNPTSSTTTPFKRYKETSETHWKNGRFAPFIGSPSGTCDSHHIRQLPVMALAALPSTSNFWLSATAIWRWVSGTGQQASGTCQQIFGTWQQVAGTRKQGSGTCEQIFGTCQQASVTCQQASGTCQHMFGI